MNPIAQLLLAAGCFGLAAVGAVAQSSSTPGQTATPANPTRPVEDPGQTTDDTSTSRRSGLNSNVDAKVGGGDRGPARSKDTLDRLSTDSARFKTLDTDGDNRISRSEFTLAPNLQMQTGAEAAGQLDRSKKKIPDDNGMVGRSATGTTDSDIGRDPSSNSYERFNDLDTDRDGFLSPAELATSSQPDAKK